VIAKLMAPLVLLVEVVMSLVTDTITLPEGGTVNVTLGPVLDVPGG
jgi:hypothetical protein